MSAATTTGLRWPNAAPRRSATHLRTIAAIITLLLLAVFLSAAPLGWAIAGIMGAVLGLGLLIQPALGLFLLALAIPWSSPVLPPITAAGPVDILVGLVIALWLARGVVRRQIRLDPPALWWILLIFVWIAALSLTQAFSWREGLPEWLKWAEFAALYLVASQLVGPRSSKWLIAALFISGLSQVALGAHQFIRQVGPEAFMLPGGYMRAYGTFEQPNPYAGYLGYLAPVAASLGLWAVARWWRERKAPSLLLALALAGITAALVAGIVMSWSRGGWLGLVAALVVVAGLRNWRTAAFTGAILVVAIGTVLLFGATWLPGSIASRGRDLGGYVGSPDLARTEITDENFSVLERLAHWQAGIQMFEEHPWLGVGIGNYGVNYGRYPQPHWYEPLGHAHNVFVNFAAETGILGLGAFLLLWLGIVYVAARQAWAKHGWISALAIGVLGTWTYLTVHGLFDNLFVQHMQLQLALLMAALTVAARPAPLAPTALSQSGTDHGSRTAHAIAHVE